MSEYKNPSGERAAALWNAGDGSAPVVVAAGQGFVAEKIVELARKNDIPVYQDYSLASLLSQIDPGADIPPGLYQAVAELYLWLLDTCGGQTADALARADGGGPQPAEIRE